jgi:PhzF family phenazine biosynthesis protein
MKAAPLFYVDAFSDRLYQGNPAAVCLLSQWLSDATLQHIATEINFSETAFLVKRAAGFDLRWFTPITEVKLCGHATLACAHVLYQHMNYVQDHVDFYTKSGVLTVSVDGDFLALDLPKAGMRYLDNVPPIISKALGAAPLDVLIGEDLLVLVQDEETVRNLVPQMDLISQINCRGVMVTAPGRSVDFVSRFFAPRLGVPEDPVTGSAHCVLAPYWAERLGKLRLSARQLSKRGGDLVCEVRQDRVVIIGQAVTFMSGQMFI